MDRETNKSDQPQTGPRMKQVHVIQDNIQDKQRIVEENNMKSSELQSGKLTVAQYREKTNSRIKYHSTPNLKPKQLLNNNQSSNIGQGKKQYFSQTKTKNKIRRVEGYAPREEIVKIQGHPEISQEVLIQSLGNVRPIKASKSIMSTLK
jgi:hypothetical protein